MRLVCPLLALLSLRAFAAEISEEKDILLLANGERLIGRLLRSNGPNLTFKSDSAGPVTVPWSVVEELRTARPFAVVENSMRLGRNEDSARIPQGVLIADSETIRVQPADGRRPDVVEVKNAAHLIDESTFGRLIDEQSVLAGWKGSLTAGATLVQGTQQGRTFTGAVHLVRAIPPETWLQARSRSSVDFNGAYGIVTQPATPKLKTEIYHVGGEHDIYFTSRFFVFGTAAFDHNFSQGLDFQQGYGGGIGWSIAKSTYTALDVKASATYLRQQFQDPQPNQNLIGSTFAETFRKRLRNGIILQQKVSVTPTYNNRNAYAASGEASLTVPLYKHLSFTVGSLDTFINNPTPGFRKNSFQLTTGLTFTLQ